MGISNNQKILTISIAAYNMEKYIRQTLRSVLDKRVIDDIEIFVIDDGGTDNTLNITKEYAERYPDVVIPVHKSNGGYGSTVNYSMANATGKYFKLLDGDDWFETECFINYIHFLKSTDVDMVITPYKLGADDKNLKNKVITHIENNKIYAISEITDSWPITMWTLTIKTNLIQNKWEDLPHKSFYTDILYVLYAIAYSNNLIYIDEPVYCYRKNRDGNSTNKKTLTKHYLESWNIAKTSAKFYENTKNTGLICSKMLLSRAASSCAGAFKATLYQSMSLKNYKLLQQFDREIKDISSDVYYDMESYGKIGRLIKSLRFIGI